MAFPALCLAFLRALWIQLTHRSNDARIRHLLDLYAQIKDLQRERNHLLRTVERLQASLARHSSMVFRDGICWSRTLRGEDGPFSSSKGPVDLEAHRAAFLRQKLTAASLCAVSM